MDREPPGRAAAAAPYGVAARSPGCCAQRLGSRRPRWRCGCWGCGNLTAEREPPVFPGVILRAQSLYCANRQRRRFRAAALAFFLVKNTNA